MIVIILGSKSDRIVSHELIANCKTFGISYKLHFASAHKTPRYLLKLLDDYEKSSNELVFITVAGRSNALGGFVDACVTRPVINCPPYSDKYAGMDILSSLRMPTGVAALTVLEPDQAVLAAVKILALNNASLQGKIRKFHQTMEEKILQSDDSVKK